MVFVEHFSLLFSFFFLPVFSFLRPPDVQQGALPDRARAEGASSNRQSISFKRHVATDIG
jgi:hypothetical protein